MLDPANTKRVELGKKKKQTKKESREGDPTCYTSSHEQQQQQQKKKKLPFAWHLDILLTTRFTPLLFLLCLFFFPL